MQDVSSQVAPRHLRTVYIDGSAAAFAYVALICGAADSCAFAAASLKPLLSLPSFLGVEQPPHCPSLLPTLDRLLHAFAVLGSGAAASFTFMVLNVGAAAALAFTAFLPEQPLPLPALLPSLDQLPPSPPWPSAQELLLPPSSLLST